MMILVQSFLNELSFIAKSWWRIAYLFAMPLAIIVAIAAMVYDGVARELPIVLVDNDSSTLSRNINEKLNSSPVVKIIARENNLENAKNYIISEKALVIIYIPRGAQDGLLRANIKPIYIFNNATYLSTAGLAASEAKSSISSAISSFLEDSLSKRGLPNFHFKTPQVNISVLMNPQTSFEWYFQAMIIPASLHLLIACMTALVAGRSTGLMADENISPPKNTTNKILAIWGRCLVYVLVVTIYAALWLFWISGIRGWQINGSTLLIIIGFVMLFGGTAAISIFLVILTKDVITTMSFSAVYAGSSMAYSGGTLPLNGAIAFAKIWSAAIPFAHFLTLQMDQFLGASTKVALPQIGILSLYIIIPTYLSFILLFIKDKKEAAI